MATNLEIAERIDRAIATAERRRDAAYREITRHRTTLGADLRRAVADVVETSFVVTAPPTAMAEPE